MPRVLAEILRKAPLTPEKVAFAWRSAVGATVDAVTRVDLVDGTLIVEAKDARWQQEIQRTAPVIRDRLSTVLGDAVARLEVRHADAPAPAPERQDARTDARARRR